MHKTKNILPVSIMNLANAYYGSCVLFSACETGVFDLLHEFPGVNASFIASRISCDSAMVDKLCNACVALNLLKKEGSRFYLTQESETFLVSGSPANLSGALMYNRDIYPAWGKLSECVRKGNPVEKPELHLGEDPVRTRNFVEAMYGRAMAIGHAALPHLDFSAFKNILDVGGGSGAFASLIAQRYANISYRIIDLPPIVRIARELVDAKFQKSILFTEGDYHSIDFPQGNDCVLFFGVLHQESAADILALLKKAFISLNGGGTIAVMDMFTNATRTAPLFSTLFSLTMSLTKDNGWVFSDVDMGRWLEETGFRGYTVKPVGGSMPHWIATAQKP
jgi:3-hydroxy-5-methyl-1-naphthoate 3-O-methyltransferase